MIVFDLRCENGHGFEEWFKSSSDYETKRDAAEIACPECGDTHIEKGLMAPRVNGGAAAPMPATPCGMPACAGGTCAMMDG
ncbi:MAG: DUF1178 family protein [Rhodospirillales bacterium]